MLQVGLVFVWYSVSSEEGIGDVAAMTATILTL